jgi:hypothetical protein
MYRCITRVNRRITRTSTSTGEYSNSFFIVPIKRRAFVFRFLGIVHMYVEATNAMQAFVTCYCVCLQYNHSQRDHFTRLDLPRSMIVE